MAKDNLPKGLGASASTISRRNLLRNVGIATGALATTTLPAEAQMTRKERLIQKDHKTHNRLLRKRRKNDWSLRKFRNAVQKAGSELQCSIVTVEFADESGQEIESITHSDGGTISTQRIDRGDMSLEVDVIIGANADTGALSWTWSNIGVYDMGESPWDYAMLGWSNNDYLYDGYNENPYANPEDMYLWKRDPTGTIVRFDDTIINYGESDTASYSVNLIREAPGEKMVYGSFHHTWNSVELSSVGFSSSGPVITFANGSKEWHIRDRQGSHYNG